MDFVRDLKTMEKRPLLSKDFVICSMIAFFYIMMFFMTYTGMTAYVRDEFQTDSMIAAIAVSIFIVGDLIARLFSHRIIDRLGLRMTVVASLLVSSILSIMYLAAWDVASMCILRLVHGMAYGAMGTAVNTKVSLSIPSERMGEGMGYFMMSVSIGSALGPMACMMLSEDGVFTDVFLLGFAMSLMGFLCSLFLTKDVPVAERHDRPKGLVERSAIPISVVALVFFFSYSGVLSFISSYGNEIGLTEFATFFFVALSVSTLVSRMFLGKMYDTKGENALMIPSFLLFILGMAIFATTDNGWLLLLSGAMMGVNVALMLSIGNAVVIKLTKRDRVAVAISTFNIFVDLAYVIGPIVIGMLIDDMGYRDSYMAMAAVATFSLILYYFLHGRLVTAGKIPKGSF